MVLLQGDSQNKMFPRSTPCFNYRNYYRLIIWHSFITNR